jgi:hypothetical protein
LNYCKHCGGNLTDASQPGEHGSRNVLAALILAGATVALVLGGLTIVLDHALMLLSREPGNGLSSKDVTAIAGMIICFGSAAIVLSTLMLIRLFSRVMGFGSVSGKPARTVATPQFAPRLSQIPAPPIVIPSVTEHTTRNFEPHIRQRGTSE